MGKHKKAIVLKHEGPPEDKDGNEELAVYWNLIFLQYCLESRVGPVIDAIVHLQW